MKQRHRLRLALVLLRVGVFVVMATWSLDKLLQPEHAGAVFENFYYLSGIGTTLLAGIAVVQLAIEVTFVLGLWKTLTYGYVLVAHGLSTVASWRQYLDPLDNLMFLTAIPMLAACAALFLLRREDTLATVSGDSPGS